MRRSAGLATALTLIAMAVAGVGASSASAFGITNWEAGTCTTETCTYAGAPAEFFTQAAGHPNFGVTDFSVAGESGNQPKRVKVELPQGLNVNPQAVPQCSEAAFKADACTAASEVGTSEVTSEVETPLGVKIPVGPLPFPVYDLTPRAGEPALFGFHVTLKVPILEQLVSEFVFLETAIEWGGDYHESFFINGIEEFPPLGRNRLVFNGRAGDGSFLTLPSPCNGNSTSILEIEGSGGAISGPVPTTPPVAISGCQKVPFAPTVGASAGTTTDTSATTSVSLNVPQHPTGTELNTSTVRNANVTLPVGAALNPATAPGLKFCPDKNFPLKGKAPTTCPAESQVR